MSLDKRRRTGPDDTPVIASGSMPEFLRDRRLPDLSPDCDRTRADLEILLRTYSHKLSFRLVDLDEMDDYTKKVLLSDVYSTLGIAPLVLDESE